MKKLIVLASLFGLAGCGTFGLSSEPPVYVVFFADHQTTVTADGVDIVRHIASDAKLKGADMVQITGPSTKIAPGYDPALAEPRIEAVEAMLIADGVSKDRLARASLTTTDVNVKADPSGAQRVEIRLIDKPGA
jgi:predicted small lipoprotein YifL